MKKFGPLSHIYAVMFIQMSVAAGTHVVAKAVVGTMPATTLTLIRTVVTALGMMLLLSLRGISFRIERKDLGIFLVLGFLGVSLNQFLYLYGLAFTTAPNAALLYATTPAFVMLVSYYTIGERISLMKLSGIMLSFAGVLSIIFEKGIDLGGGYTYGNILIFIAVLAWVAFTVGGKRVITKYGTLKSTGMILIIGAILFFPFGIVTSYDFNIMQLSPRQWGGILYLGLGTSVVGYLLWYYALGRIDASKVAVFANGQPILATILAAIFLHTELTLHFILSACLTLTGVIITQRSK